MMMGRRTQPVLEKIHLEGSPLGVERKCLLVVCVDGLPVIECDTASVWLGVPTGERVSVILEIAEGQSHPNADVRCQILHETGPAVGVEYDRVHRCGEIWIFPLGVERNLPGGSRCDDSPVRQRDSCAVSAEVPSDELLVSVGECVCGQLE